MAMAALSPSSVLASPIQVNPQVRSDLQTSVPQVAEDAQKAAKSVQTDTVTISPQALKMADDKNSVAEEDAKKAEEQQQALQSADDKVYSEKRATQKKAVEAYAAVSANR